MDRDRNNPKPPPAWTLWLYRFAAAAALSDDDGKEFAAYNANRYLREHGYELRELEVSDA